MKGAQNRRLTMVAKPKAELMARLREQRRAKGLCYVQVVVYEEDKEAIQNYAAELTKVREAYKGAGDAT